MKQTAKDKIIFALVRKDGQTFTSLLAEADTNRDSLAKGLIILKKEKLVKKDQDGLYHFTTELKHPIFSSFPDAYTIMKNLNGFLEGIEKDGNPFHKSVEMIYHIMRLQMILKLERYSSPKLTKRDNLEFDLFFYITDAATQLIFEILYKRNPKRTETLKNYLLVKLTPLTKN